MPNTPVLAAAPGLPKFPRRSILAGLAATAATFAATSRGRAKGVGSIDTHAEEAELVALAADCLAFMRQIEAALKVDSEIDARWSAMRGALYGDGPRHPADKWGDREPADKERWRAVWRQTEKVFKAEAAASTAALSALTKRHFAFATRAMEIRATTFRGLMAKAQIACSDGPDCEPLQDLAFNILADMMALAGQSTVQS